jgi:predicted ATP-grasp superfamily ATP-dependent carboligase
VRRFHRCPGLGVDPEGYLSFIVDLVSSKRFDVLLPTHEQGFLFAKAQDILAEHVAIALPSFESYALAHSKAGFSRLLSDLGLPQPRTSLVRSAKELIDLGRIPSVIKLTIGTASRGIWMVHNEGDLKRAVAELEACDAFTDVVVVQDLATGPLERAQGVFSRGQLLALHGYRQILVGAGGGDLIKESVFRPIVQSHMARLGERLGWHGALSVDYILREADGTPFYIDCNPRLVEPVNAMLSGTDLGDLLVRLSLGESVAVAPSSRVGTRTHMAIQGLLRSALDSGSRRELIAECRRLFLGREPYAASQEELTPVRWDWLAGLPLGFVALRLLMNPGAAKELAKNTARSHQLDLRTVHTIRNMGRTSSAVQCHG